MYNRIRFLFKKFLSIFEIFRWRKHKNEELVKQHLTYAEANLELLLNSYAFIKAAKKTKEEEIDQYADSSNDDLTHIFEPLCNRKEDRNAIN